MAGEFFTAAKLFKRGYQTSVTLGNAKAIDLFTHNPQIKETFSVQVKTLRKRDGFDLKKEDIEPKYIYVFVFLLDFEEPEEFFILRGETILADIDHFFGSSYKRAKPSTRPLINYGPLKRFKDNWDVFDKKLDHPTNTRTL